MSAKVLLDHNPLAPSNAAPVDFAAAMRTRPAWITPEQPRPLPEVTAYRLHFDLPDATQIRVHVSADEVAPGDPAIAPLEAESAWAFTDDEFGLAWDAGGSSSCDPASAPRIACSDDFDGLRLCLPGVEVVDCIIDAL